MAVERDQRDWQELAEHDPYWAALTDPAKRAGGWDAEAFAASGEREVDGLLAHAELLGYPAHRRAALDFGCGPGRLSRALARHFDRVVGIDVSEAMVARARESARDAENCRFLAGPDAVERLDDRSFDLVYSNLVLQHVSDSAAVLEYARQFVRVLSPSGLLVFQLPSHVPFPARLQPRRRLYRWLRGAGLPADSLHRRLRLDPIGIYAVERAPVVAAIERASGRVLRVDEEAWPRGIQSATYFVTR